MAPPPIPLIDLDDHEAIERVDRIDYRHAGEAILRPHAEALALARLASGQTVPLPFSADCSRRYTAVHHSGRRPLSAIEFVVMHAEEALTAESAASWFTSPAAGGSTQLCCDANVCYRTLANDLIPWGAPGANYRGFHIEEAGYTAWHQGDWPAGTIERSAFKCGQHLRKFDLPPVFIDADDLRKRRKGITTHLECTRAFGGDHTDPGSGWPRARFVTRAKYWHDRL